MEQLKGRLYIVPIKEEDASALQNDDEKLRTRSMISELLGLEKVPEKWIQVRALDEQNLDENGKIIGETPEGWRLKEYGVQGFPGVIFFPHYLPADLFAGKKENDTIIINYADLKIQLTLTQVPYTYGNHGCFEEVYAAMTDDVSFHERLKTPVRESELEREPKPKRKMPKWAAVALCLAGGVIVFIAGTAFGISVTKRGSFD
jgi:hypothetical protein